MKLFILIHEQDTDSAWGADATPFLDSDAAEDAMRTAYEAALKAWEFDESVQTEEHECFCEKAKASIRDDSDIEHWRIEEHEVGVKMAIRVKGGFVEEVYTNTDICPDVYDLDTPRCTDDGEPEKTGSKEDELEELVRQPGWRTVW